VTTTDRAAALLEDILAGPAELAAVAELQRAAIAAIPAAVLARPRWRLVGMGSSRFAAMDTATRLRAAGYDAHAEVASALSPSPGGRDTILVAVSSSGQTPEVLEAVERHRGTSFVVGLTADTASPLAGLADAVLPLRATHAEQAGIACLTYRATVAALLGLTVRADGGPAWRPAEAVSALEMVIADRGPWLGAAADVLDGARDVHVLGDGSRAGAAEQAALMLREAPRLPATAFDTGDWLHVGLYTLFPGDPVLLFGGARADLDALQTIRNRGGCVVAVGPVPDSAPMDVHVALPEIASAQKPVRLLVESVVAELLAAELWRRTDAVPAGERSRA